MKKLFLIPALLFCFAVTPALAADIQASFKSACSGCHGPAGEKPLGSAPLRGQNSAEVFAKLKGYADGTYGGPAKAAMGNIAKKHAYHWQELADYIGTLR